MVRSYARVVIGKLAFVTACCFPVPLALFVGFSAWSDGQAWAWIPLLAGVLGLVLIGVIVRALVRGQYPRITRADRTQGADVPAADDAFVMWAPRSPRGHPRARLVRADVLEASLALYSPEGGTFTTYGDDRVPDEFTPLVRMRLRVHDSDEEGSGTAAFEVTDEWRVPSLCLSAVTVGRLAVLVAPADPAAPRTRATVTPLWPGSTLLAGTRTCRVVDLDGRCTDMTARPGLLLRQMRISRSAGGVAMTGDTIDLRGLDAHTAERYAEVAEQDRALPEGRAPSTEPGEESRRLMDSLPGEPAGFGSVGRRWARRGGVLLRARFRLMRGTLTFQVDGPVLDTVLRIQPTDGSPPFDAARRLTVPLNYLAVIHRTREVVLQADPSGRAYVVDWARTNLLAGTTTAKVVTPEGRELPLAERPDVLWAVMNLLAARGLSNPHPVLDLRDRRMRGVVAEVLDLTREQAAAAVGPPPA
ncbi:hypothetical protein ACFYRN_20430 [Streptomyces sp. NPDC005227]|uniref:hypothetical protein n=1 Tax=unclassified Streptomyces TaxID=2593676 RepID=UPI0036BEDF5C